MASSDHAPAPVPDHEPGFEAVVASHHPRSRFALWSWGIGLTLALALFVSLGTWQVKRLAWKLDLIERVEARIHAAPVSAPPPEQWAGVTTAQHEYRHVRLRGRFRHDREALVQASSVLGTGFWVITPLQTEGGAVVMVNRGFVTAPQRDPAQRGTPAPEGLVEVVGLMRMPEPGGGFLRSNRPEEDRWYSRDLAAIGQARGWQAGQIAPYFIDMTQAPEALSDLSAPLAEVPRWTPPPAQVSEIAVMRWAERQPRLVPMPGLTVVSFSNNHLMYAITWYGLALMVLVAAWFLWRDARRRRR
ncbi:MAG: SURF1 family protein [Lautropia sp.]|nr:SURF1 family protein [Lautropia sp.]